MRSFTAGVGAGGHGFAEQLPPNQDGFDREAPTGTGPQFTELMYSVVGAEAAIGVAWAWRMIAATLD